jgi:hypothetical protein
MAGVGVVDGGSEEGPSMVVWWEDVDGSVVEGRRR